MDTSSMVRYLEAYPRHASAGRHKSFELKGYQGRSPWLVRGRHFQDELIVLCVRWYMRYSLGLRDLEEQMAERTPQR